MKAHFPILTCALLSLGFVSPSFSDTNRQQELAQENLEILLSGKEEGREFSKVWLANNPSSYSLVAANSNALVPVLSDFSQSEQSCVLLGLLDVPGDTREALLRSDVTPLKVKARLGDELAAAVIEQQLAEASTVSALRKYASDLLYVDTPRSIEVFLAYLVSDEVIHDHGGAYSYAQPLIQVYGSFHPEVELFSPAYYGQFLYTDESNPFSEAHQDYLKNVGAYLSKKYERPITLAAPFLIQGQPPGHEYFEREH